jgi:hypothetical protein
MVDALRAIINAAKGTGTGFWGVAHMAFSYGFRKLQT